MYLVVLCIHPTQLAFPIAPFSGSEEEWSMENRTGSLPLVFSRITSSTPIRTPTPGTPGAAFHGDGWKRRKVPKLPGRAAAVWPFPRHEEVNKDSLKSSEVECMAQNA